MTSNKESTRYFSTMQEEAICKALGAKRQSNSGAGHFRKGDCINKEASLLIEAKCAMKDKNSFSIKKEWIEKNKEESFTQHCSNQCIAFDFGPSSPNYYIINERLMKFLVNKLEAENS